MYGIASCMFMLTIINIYIVSTGLKWKLEGVTSYIKEGKTAITLTPPTVDKVPTILFRRPTKNITTVLFFSSADSFLGFGNQPTIGRYVGRCHI